MRTGPASAAVLRREAMRDLDARSIAAGIPSIELMERAGLALADFLSEPTETGIALPADERTPRRLLVLAGSGNNGGDGFVVARLLASRRWRCTVALVGREPRAGGDAATNLAEWRRIGGRVVNREEALALLAEGATGFDLGLDAVFGTGLDRDVRGPDADFIHRLNQSGLPIVSVDIPSGLCSDTGRPLGCAVRARATLTIGAAKPGLFLADGPDHAGRVRVADIGLLAPEDADRLDFVLAGATTAGCLPRLSPMAHKGSRGHVVIVAGSRGKTGAAVLAARGALRAGAGLVTVAAVAEVQAAVAAALPEAMTRVLAATSDGELSVDCLEGLRLALAVADVVVIGPGLGTGEGAEAALGEAIACPAPLVIDADGLNVLATWPEQQRRTMFSARVASGSAAPILTPHPGEMSRLVGLPTADVQQSRAELALNLSKSLMSVVVLKGAGTVVSWGGRSAFNTSGNAGMATGGMGDVLAGLCGALVARLGDPFEAACLAVHVHGVAGDRLAQTTGTGFLAGELADLLPAVLATRQPR